MKRELHSYLSLIPLSARVRRRENRMTVLCILIAVLLVTAIFSMANMGIRMETARVIESHGHWHAMLKPPAPSRPRRRWRHGPATTG